MSCLFLPLNAQKEFFIPFINNLAQQDPNPSYEIQKYFNF